MNALVRYTAIIDGIPKVRAALISICPLLKEFIAPIKAAQATITNEYDVASNGSKPNKYTNIGKVRIEPPEPSNPRTNPINKTAKYPIDSTAF